MTGPATKAQRVRAVLDVLARTECSARDLTERLGLPLNKLRSVQRDLEELQATGEVERTACGKYRRPLRASTFNPVEALAVYSAARMLYHHASQYNEHYLSAMEKLTAQLPAPARRVAVLANEAYRQRPNGGESRTFEMVAQAWLHSRVLQAQYHSLNRMSEVELVIYFIELNARNREAYAIGVDRLRENASPRVYRLTRLRNVSLLNDTCEIPEDFHPLQFLSHAWGIMVGEPQKVELFFSPAVRDRVAETHLGAGAECFTLASGHTRVVMTVGGWQELVPWILGWGAEVEVVTPADLRAHIASVLQHASAQYPLTPALSVSV
ncbi:WYL domain-containing protein (plasmid) [Deinococcus taeanensis]|uniref:helix-turn-helix transcriptional regulator n=1 Tax=Deinococcus taeanensis TaxID=2737050 RepID=UPI001CDCA9E8|nr:WYL domain-containing protein [Deinococcus taeanensis]UBV45524.1 WYL domain-containing protein [Deinococcus taeanensis]